MTERFNIPTLVRSRSGHRSYHVAAEQYVRIEFRNMAAGETIEPFVYAGDVVVTCYRGLFSLAAGKESHALGELDQVVVSRGTRVSLECTQDGTIQVIWAPGQATTVKG